MHWVPPLIFVEINSAVVSDGIDSVEIAPHSFKESTAVEARVDPNGSIFSNGPYHSRTVSFYMAEVSSYLRP